MNETIKKVLESELESKDLIFPFVSGLTNREKLVLELRSQNKKLEEIGEQMTPKLSRERVRQIEEKAKEKIAFQKKIIETLSQKLGEVLFDENEIQATLTDWLVLLGLKLDFAQRKVKALDFIKSLWVTKRDSKKQD